MVAKTASKTTTRKVKLFKNGASQAVRLPAEFRFEGTEIYATRDNETGEVTLSQHAPEIPDKWKAFFELARQPLDPNDPDQDFEFPKLDIQLRVPDYSDDEETN